MRAPSSTALGLLALGLGSCLAPPPPTSVDARRGRVRAADPAEARAVGALLDQLVPRVLTELPDSDVGELEVWVQETPKLYRSARPASSDAEGLWAESHRRILLGRRADNLERTLAHELVHACLGRSWRVLPGSLEEGLCDLVSSRVTSAGGARLRAGRLSSAALACGGLELELEIRPDEDLELAGGPPGWFARIVLSGEPQEDDAHLEVFRIEAGLSSSTLAPGTKRGFYGLSFLVIERIAARWGLDGLNEICRQTSDEGLRQVPRGWLLTAAGLDDERDSWRRAAAEAFGPAELVELLRMYPDFVVDSLVGYLDAYAAQVGPDELLDRVHARLRLVEGDADVDVTRLEFVRRGVLARRGR